jgi:hypothetical protein
MIAILTALALHISTPSADPKCTVTLHRQGGIDISGCVMTEAASGDAVVLHPNVPASAEHTSPSKP